MEELKQLIDSISEQRKQIIDEIGELRENFIVKRYLELIETNETLLNEKKELIRELRLKEFNSCQHLWIITKSDHDYIEGRTEKFYGCVKCGLNQEVLNEANSIYGTKYFNLEKQIMYDYLKKGICMKGYMLDVFCDFSLAKSIYKKIKEYNPDIDDETVCKYFEIALDNIRKIKVSDERKENRAKRLSLSPKFNKWDV